MLSFDHHSKAMNKGMGLCPLGLNSFAVQMTHIVKEVAGQPEASGDNKQRTRRMTLWNGTLRKKTCRRSELAISGEDGLARGKPACKGQRREAKVEGCVEASLSIPAGKVAAKQHVTGSLCDLTCPVPSLLLDIGASGQKEI